MLDPITAHPEIKNFNKDRFYLSNGVKSYIFDFKEHFPQIFNALKSFRQVFSSQKKFTSESITELKKACRWTFTKRQYQFAIAQLRRICEKYPVPKELESKIKEGDYLDLRDVTDKNLFYKKLDNFAKQIKKKTPPESVKFDIQLIGKLPIKLIHQKENKDYFDPIIGENMDTVWTLDVSFNPGLSVKDIMAKQMVEDALKSKLLTRESIIVEGTSGNTGVGLALVALFYGMKTILIIPDKMSQEKIDRLRFLGSHVIVAPSKVDPDDPKSYYNVRDYMAKVTKGWKSQQYDNLSNRKAHENISGPVIWEQTKGKVTALIAPAGTGGTITGIARYLKKKNPKIKIIAVDTVGSILYLLKEGYSIEEVQKYARSYTLQGFGEDIHPKNYDFSCIDHFIRISDASGLEMTRLLPALGFVCGQSSGASYATVIEAINKGIIRDGDKVVAIFPDIGVPYRMDVYNDQWIKNKGFNY